MTTTTTTTTTTKTYDHHHGLQKMCTCPRTRWLSCPHSWYLRWTPPGQKRVQIKIDGYAGQHIDQKKEAATLAIEIKGKLLAGTFQRTPRPLLASAPAAPAAPAIDAPMTITRLGELYFAAAKNKRTGKPLTASERYKWQQVCGTTITRPTNQATTRIGDIPAASLTSFDIEAFRAVQATPREVEITDMLGKRYPARRGGTVSSNRIVGRWRAVYTWAVKTGHLEATPFLKGGISIIEHYGEQRRDRRLEEGEGEQLLAHASQDLRDLFDVAIRSACRKSELLGLRWYQVRWLTNEIALDGKQTKNGKARLIPMLGPVRQILERRRTDPDGEPYGPMAFVFGDVTGAKRADIKTAWTTMRLKAAGFSGVIRDPEKGRLTPEAKAALKAYNLKWHDLRREAASSFVDAGMDPRAVQTFLDHANIATTNTYLRLSQKALHAEVARMEARLVNRGQIGKGLVTAEADRSEAGVERPEADGGKLKAV